MEKLATFQQTQHKLFVFVDSDSIPNTAGPMLLTQHSGYATTLKSGAAAQPQAVYAKVQRRAERNNVALLYTNAEAVAGTTSGSSSLSSSSGAAAAAAAAAGQSMPAAGSCGSIATKEKSRTFHVTLYKDNVYDDYGFSLSDGLYERGVFINRIRSGGPADVVGLLKPFDRIMQVKGYGFSFELEILLGGTTHLRFILIYFFYVYGLKNVW